MSPVVFSITRRLIILALISILGVLLVSEVSYRLLREDHSRAPGVIQLVIPVGTAKRIAVGEDEPSIPEDMVFVVGDVLSVKNEDATDHQLGPLWIPAGKTASLPMGQVMNYVYSCSFKPSQYLGITVREPVTWTARVGAVALAAPPTLVLLFVYSLVARPIKPGRRSICASDQGEAV
jgi:hypothetical protein